MSKIFREELIKFYEKLRSGKPFCLNKYADGEAAIIRGQSLNNNEFNFQGEEFYSQQLLEALRFQDAEYYVGISCPCCGPQDSLFLLEKAGQPWSNLTYANIWVNSNHDEYKKLFFPEFAKRDIVLVANENSKIENLPFKVEKFYPVGNTAFIQNHGLIQEIVEQNYEDKLLLFCAGPLGNLASHAIWEVNQKNTILDIGSSLNNYLGGAGFLRDYLAGGMYSGRECKWFY